MTRVRNVTGLAKTFLKLIIVLRVFFYILPLLFRELSLWRFVQLARRLLFFLDMFGHNKFVEIDGKTRLDLYLPGFPSKAFLRSCDKFMVFDERLPCLTVLVSVTRACSYRCEHCYQRLDSGKDAPIEVMVNVVKRLQEKGVTFFNIEGGEPFIVFDRLMALCEAIDDRAEIWVNSTGVGVTKERLMALRQTPVTALMFSLRAPTQERFDALFGKPGAWKNTMDAIELSHEVGIAVAFNACLSRDDFFNGTFEAVMDKAKELRGAIIQLIHPKSAGGWLQGGSPAFSKEDIEHIKRRVHQYNNDKAYRDYPSISAQIVEEDSAHLGCTAGGVDRFYVNAQGDVQPCEFLNLSFGNVLEEDFDLIYDRMRRVFNPASTSWMCERYSHKIRELYEKHELKSLPLPKELSEEVYQDWDLGAPTAVYEKIRKMK